MDAENKFLIEGRFRFKDLVDIKKLTNLFDDFSLSSGVAAGLASYPDHEFLIATGRHDICNKFHNAFPASEKNCERSNMTLISAFDKGKKLNISLCGNGLIDGAIPVIVKDVHIADIIAGQILFEKPDIDFFTRQGNAYNYNIDAYLKALADVPILKRNEFELVLKFLSNMAVMLAEQRLAERKYGDALRKLALYEDILSICSYCKKIRNDAGTEPGKGRWESVEAFVRKNNDIIFSHGICPECYEKLTSDLKYDERI